MVRKRIVWAKEALLQKFRIFKYWKNKTGNTSYPRRIESRIRLVEKTITANPEIYKPSEFPHIREAAMGDFSLYYMVDEGSIVVLAFWDNRQDPDKLDQFLTE